MGRFEIKVFRPQTIGAAEAAPDMGLRFCQTGLELQVQRQLQKARAADGVGDRAERGPKRRARRAGISPLKAGTGSLRKTGYTARANIVWWVPKERIEPHVIVGRIEAWMIEEVEALCIKTQ